MTAEDFMHHYNKLNNTEYCLYDTNTKLMVEFAKYHIEKYARECDSYSSHSIGACGIDEYAETSFKKELDNYFKENL